MGTVVGIACLVQEKHPGLAIISVSSTDILFKITVIGVNVSS